MNQLEAVIHIDRACGPINEYDYFVDPSVLSRTFHFDFIAVSCDAIFSSDLCLRLRGWQNEVGLTTDN